MRTPSIIAIYALFWATSFFLVLPFRPGARGTAHRVVGQADSAPPRFSLARACLWTTIVSAVLFGLFWSDYLYGWLPVDRLNLVPDSWLMDPGEGRR